MYPCDFSGRGAACQAAGGLVSQCPVQLAGSRIAQVSAVAPEGKELVESVGGVEPLDLGGFPVPLSSWGPTTSALTPSGSLFTCNCVLCGSVCVSLWALWVPSLGAGWGSGWRREQGVRASEGLSSPAPAGVTRLGLNK